MKISILGCGWLGKPLAIYLIKKGFSVKGSASSREKVSLLIKEGIDACQVDCAEDNVYYEDVSFFDSDMLIINIPPRRTSGFNYSKSMRHLAMEVSKQKIKRVIFVSATSVYPDNGKLVMEADAKPSTERSKTLLDAENHFLKKPEFKTTVLRMSGLIGPGRIPGVTKKNVDMSDGPVNLIHLDDCISIIHQALIQNPENSVYNASCPEHPLRSSLYAQVRTMGYETVNISKEVDENKKMVSSQKLINDLGYTFKYKNPLEIGKEGYES